MSKFLIAREQLVVSLYNTSAVQLQCCLSIVHTFSCDITQTHKIHFTKSYFDVHP